MSDFPENQYRIAYIARWNNREALSVNVNRFARFSTQCQFFLEMISLNFKRLGSAKLGNLFINTFEIQTIHFIYLFI